MPHSSSLHAPRGLPMVCCRAKGPDLEQLCPHTKHGRVNTPCAGCIAPGPSPLAGAPCTAGRQMATENQAQRTPIEGLLFLTPLGHRARARARQGATLLPRGAGNWGDVGSLTGGRCMGRHRAPSPGGQVALRRSGRHWLPSLRSSDTLLSPGCTARLRSSCSHRPPTWPEKWNRVT